MYLPVKRDKIVRAPWGYTPSPDDPYLLLPLHDQLKALDEGMKMLDRGASLRKTAVWISKQCGVKISQTSLKNFYEKDPTREEAREKRKKLIGNYTSENIMRKGKKGLTEEKKELRQLNRLNTRVTRKKKKLIKLREEQAAVQDKLAEVSIPKTETTIILPAAPEAVHKQVEIRPNPGPQTDFLAASEFQVLFGGQAGGGKQVSLDTLIPTTSGMVRMEDIKLGDFVISDKGKPVEVIWKSDVDTNADAYKVTFDTGEEIICDGRHLWKTYDNKERASLSTMTPEWRARRRATRPSRAVQNSKKPGVSAKVSEMNRSRQYSYKVPATGSVRTTEQIFNTKTFRGSRVNHSVAVISPAEYCTKPLRIEPYLFGLWLGDGYSNCGEIGMAEADMAEVLTYINRTCCATRLSTKNRRTPFVTARFIELTADLRKLDVVKNKHIPVEYLTSSVDCRKELLRGLMDTDGTVCKKDGGCSIMFMSHKLAQDTLELICSLGIKATITTKEAKIGDKSYGTAYRINFMAGFPVFKLKRKRVLQKYPKRLTTKHRYIVEIEKVNSVPMQCIQVNDPSGMYCVGRTYIPTHNSHAITLDPLRTVHLSSHRALIFRKSMDQLRELLWMSKELYPKIVPGAVFKEQTSTWYFPSGATQWYKFLDRDEDVLTLHGQSYTHVYWDELTQWATPFAFNFMTSRIRTTDKEMRPYLRVRATTNPGSVGHAWVKKMFIDPAPYGVPFPATDIETGDTFLDDEGKPLFYRRFIPSKLADNPHLDDDGMYRRTLMALPEVQRRQLLEGDWDIAAGAAFPEFNRKYHVCEPFEVPHHWTKFRACDWGYSSPTAVLWFAVDPNGNIYVYREWYAKNVLVPDIADKILELEAGERISYGILDASAWQRRGLDANAPSIAEVMIKRGCLWRPSDRSKDSRKFGKMELHRRLQVKDLPDEITGEIRPRPSLMIFNTCLNLIRTLPVIPLSKKNPEDVDTSSEDHLHDALIYGLNSRPLQITRNFYQPHFTPVPREPSYNSFGFPV